MKIGAYITVFWLSMLAGFLLATRSSLITMRHNELGDMLAGAFSPLAFAWVVIAVFLQHKELEAQRQELHIHGEVMKVQAEQMRQTVEVLQKQAQQIQLGHKQRESDRTMQLVGDFFRRLVHLMYVVAGATEKASIKTDEDEGDNQVVQSIFGDSTFYLDCSNRDEFEIATKQFVDRLQVLKDALNDPNRLIEWPDAKMDSLRTYLIVIRDRSKLVEALVTQIPASAEAVFPFSQLPRLRQLLDEIIPQVEAWVNPA